jgi:hypothetical protein
MSMVVQTHLNVGVCTQQCFFAGYKNGKENWYHSLPIAFYLLNFWPSLISTLNLKKSLIRGVYLISLWPSFSFFFGLKFIHWHLIVFYTLCYFLSADFCSLSRK